VSAKALGGFVAISLDEIRPSPNNPRERLAEIDDLAKSIRESGLIQPIVVQRVPGVDGYQIIAGHRRFMAVQNLGWVTCPCVVRRDMLPDEELLAMLVENGQRADLDPIEEARAFRRLMASGLTKADVARRVGRSPVTVSGRLTLLSLPQAEQERIRAGHLPVSRALASATAERQQERLRQAGRPAGRPKGSATKPYFGAQHPHAKVAAALCEHRGRPKVGGIACGECWESVIRADERAAS
jgi:ParB family chromosome partitioning protein